MLPEKQVSLLVGSRQWPLLVAHMKQVRDHEGLALLSRKRRITQHVPPL
ncbi:hypothetical protein ACFWTC_38595 [Streptomyces sp. NPDC058619]